MGLLVACSGTGEVSSVTVNTQDAETSDLVDLVHGDGLVAAEAGSWDDGAGGETTRIVDAPGMPDATPDPWDSLDAGEVQTDVFGPDDQEEPCCSDDECQALSGDLGPCRMSSCDEETCECVVDDLVGPCDDDDHCTGDDHCVAGTCGVSPTSSWSPSIAERRWPH